MKVENAKVDFFGEDSAPYDEETENDLESKEEELIDLAKINPFLVFFCPTIVVETDGDVVFSLSFGGFSSLSSADTRQLIHQL